MIMTNIGAYIAPRLSLAPIQGVAAGVVDNVAQNGVGVDRTGFMSCVVEVPIAATIADAGGTCTVNVVLLDSADNIVFTAYGTAIAQVVLTSIAGGTIETALIQGDFCLRAARQFVAVRVTADLNAVGVDTERFSGSIILGGASELPV